LRNLLTAHMDAIRVDIFLAQLSQGRDFVARLQDLADEAERRKWLPLAVEARFAAWRSLKQSDAVAAAAQGVRLEQLAKAHNFGWILQRMNPAEAP